MDIGAFVNALLQRSIARGSRSTVLAPLNLLIGLLIAGAIGGPSANAPDWLVTAFGIALGVVLLVYLVTYVAFAIRKPDYLRSERYNIEKLTIEKGMIGDDAVGLMDPNLLPGQCHLTTQGRDVARLEGRGA